MNTAHTGEVQFSGHAGGSGAAPGGAGWLGLATAPVFAIMALWTGFFSGQPDVLCTAMQSSSPMSGMTLMYALMSIFHAAPWLRLISGRRSTSCIGHRPIDVDSR